VDEFERLLIFLAPHVPLRKRAFGRIAQRNDDLHLRVVSRDALERARIIEIIRGDFTGGAPKPAGIEVAMKKSIIKVAREIFFLVEKMERLIAKERDLRMLSQKIMDRGRPGLLHAGYDENDALNFSAPEKIHDETVTTEKEQDRHLASNDDSGFDRQRGGTNRRLRRSRLAFHL